MADPLQASSTLIAQLTLELQKKTEECQSKKGEKETGGLMSKLFRRHPPKPHINGEYTSNLKLLCKEFLMLDQPTQLLVVKQLITASVHGVGGLDQLIIALHLEELKSHPNMLITKFEMPEGWLQKKDVFKENVSLYIGELESIDLRRAMSFCCKASLTTPATANMWSQASVEQQKAMAQVIFSELGLRVEEHSSQRELDPARSALVEEFFPTFHPSEEEIMHLLEEDHPLKEERESLVIAQSILSSPVCGVSHSLDEIDEHCRITLKMVSQKINQELIIRKIREYFNIPEGIPNDFSDGFATKLVDQFHVDIQTTLVQLERRELEILPLLQVNGAFDPKKIQRLVIDLRGFLSYGESGGREKELSALRKEFELSRQPEQIVDFIERNWSRLTTLGWSPSHGIILGARAENVTKELK